MPVVYNSFSPASLVVLAMSSDEKLVIAETSEEFVTFEAFEHSGEELADTFYALKTWRNKFFLGSADLLSK